MPLRRPLFVVISLLFGLPLMACETSTPVLYRPQIDASLLQPCQPPVPLPNFPSDNELGAFIVRQAKAFVDCRDRHATLVDRINAE